jgi:Rieske Fe-S protein
MTDRALTRRHALAGAAGVGLGLPLLAACGGQDATGSGNAGKGSGNGSGNGGSGGGTGTDLGPASDVAVGGGTIYADQSVVVTQPSQGDFKCFSAICTHQGCPVQSVSGGTINCNCHGSRFSIQDGSVVQGPATAPLPEKKVTVKGGEITLA